MKIGIFGGSFNPPHKFHEQIAIHLIANNYVDYVIFVPTGSKYQYKHNLLADKARLHMLNLMIKDYEHMSTDAFELKDHPIHTWETLKYFKEKFPQDEIYFICGSDNLTYVDKWEKGLELLEHYHFLVLKRRTDSIIEIMNRLKKYASNITIVDLEENDLSSTYIRDNIASETIKEHLHEEVYRYIKEKELYR